MPDEGQNAEITFLIEEYKNIAATHDRLRDILVRLFNYFLILSAFPFTVLGLMLRNGRGLDVWSPPHGLRPLFVFIGMGDLLLALSLMDARLSQYRYAKTVNLIRKYFSDHSQNLKDYLFLPTDVSVPHWESFGFVAYQLYFMSLVGTALVGYGLTGLSAPRRGWILGMVLYQVLFWAMRALIIKRYKADKGIPAKASQN
jgi:hypothetical protein